MCRRRAFLCDEAEDFDESIDTEISVGERGWSLFGLVDATPTHTHVHRLLRTGAISMGDWVTWFGPGCVQAGGERGIVGE